jgi:hypothetical protein
MIISGPNAERPPIIRPRINIIFSQQFGCGFYKECNINPYTHIHSYLNIPALGRDSLFQAESRRCKEIIDIIRIKRTAISYFDELFSGTNPSGDQKRNKSATTIPVTVGEPVKHPN